MFPDPCTPYPAIALKGRLRSVSINGQGPEPNHHGLKQAHPLRWGLWASPVGVGTGIGTVLAALSP